MRFTPFPQRTTLGLLVVLLWAAAAIADDGWKPFVEQPAATKRRGTAATEPRQPFLEPMGQGIDRASSSAPVTGAFPFSASANNVERTELSPVSTDNGHGGSPELWDGLDLAAAEVHLARLELPSRSPAANVLWRRILLPESRFWPAGKFRSLHAEALLRSGLLTEHVALLTKMAGADAAGSNNAVFLVMKGRGDIALGDRHAGCAAIRDASSSQGELSKRLKSELIVLAGYCAAVSGNTRAAGLAAELAREEGYDGVAALAALDVIALGPAAAANMTNNLPKRIDVIDWRLLTLGGRQNPGTLLERADPSLLGVLAEEQAGELKLRIAAAEAAVRINVITPDRLSELYRTQVVTATEDPLLRRALLFRSAEAERNPQRQARVLRALLDDARRNGLYLPMLRASAGMIAAMPQAAEIGWFSETAIEAMLAAERYDDARRWAGASTLQHWLALIDIADAVQRAGGGDGLVSIQQLALAGRFSHDLLHRIATVLDALDYQIPIPLWEAASRSAQPNTGHLPETGILTELQDASNRKQVGRTILLALRALGGAGAEGAHIIALGDVIRALKRAGLEPDARRLGFEALFAGWPRNADK